MERAVEVLIKVKLDDRSQWVLVWVKTARTVVDTMFKLIKIFYQYNRYNESLVT